MLEWWIYLLATIGALFFGACLFAFVYIIWDTLRKMILKKRMPTDKNILLDPGKPMRLDKKEVEESERREFENARRSEEIRRDTVKRSADSGVTSRDSSITTDAEYAKRTVLSPSIDQEHSRFNRDDKKRIQSRSPNYL